MCTANMPTAARIGLGIGTMGLSEGGGLVPLAQTAQKSMTPKIPGVPTLPDFVAPQAPPPPAPTSGSSPAASSPFSLSLRPRKSQSLRTDKMVGTGGFSGLNIPS